ncbi:MAG: carboxylating nicotinate-nucleotide diphosphorylase [Gammaproteobacteria bacterium]|jgi:nicotinate-nucleotide pyrophosphorylase (carboxylating)|nr:nicotinate-nucleotide diphosphorylase (carboxylating) [Gammaproteobacteria bacterium]MDP6097340.1 carboxylating nicotinate-nucleotide diphosphorylase [Gammaproteobacteria bacterium]MDP7455847.1 carboxylating nicotinate-nucleotide diphosphorylase [Gammaproteobacteria bacterium]|tara:strand:+ start:59 stop:910 length:852 start_codon:yes stop_codon:yes gene_type:complete
MNKILPPIDIPEVVNRALTEDIGSGDITAELIPVQTTIEAGIISREDAILCGTPWVEQVFQQLDPETSIDWHAKEGEFINADRVLLSVRGKARPILSGERCALNFLQLLSGLATRSHFLAGLVAHTEVQLLDTRKTLPGLRSAQKYAVAIGGCSNHRSGLYDAFLIKENHINAFGSVSAAIGKARELYPDKVVEVEVEDLSQLDQALQYGADAIMLDNFTLDELVEAVRVNKRQAKLEASGGIDENTLVKVAETGVDYISIGALTKNCVAIDLSLLITRGSAC